MALIGQPGLNREENVMTLRDRLVGRRRPTAIYRLRVEDTAAAERELAQARADLPLLILGGDEERIAAARERVRVAEEALEACYEPIVLTALPPKEHEALVDAHPPRPGTDDEAWNTETYPRECFLACAPADLSREEWETFLAESVSDGEETALFNTAVAVNVRVPDPSVPKDWTETLS